MQAILRIEFANTNMVKRASENSGELTASIKRFKTKLRRGSFLIYWNGALIIPEKLKQLKSGNKRKLTYIKDLAFSY